MAILYRKSGVNRWYSNSKFINFGAAKIKRATYK